MIVDESENKGKLMLDYDLTGSFISVMVLKMECKNYQKMLEKTLFKIKFVYTDEKNDNKYCFCLFEAFIF